MGKRDRTIAVDFDGVIHDYQDGFKDGSLYGDPMPGAQDTLKRLVEEGYKIVIFTVRLNSVWYESEKDKNIYKDKIAVWLSEHGIKAGTHFHDLTGEKPPALVYIDDRAMRFTKWEDIRKYFC